LNGRSLANGASLAEEKINAAGGISGRQIKLVVLDDKGSPNESQAVFDRLINQEKVLLIIGPTISPQAERSWVFANSQKVVAIGTSITTSGLTKGGPFLFRVTATEDLMTPASVKAAAAVYKSKTVGAIFQDDDNFAYGAYMAALRGFAREGMKVVARETIREKDKAFEEKLARIKAAQPDVLYISSRANDAVEIIMMARKMGMNMPIIGSNNFVSQTIYDTANRPRKILCLRFHGRRSAKTARTWLSWPHRELTPIPLANIVGSVNRSLNGWVNYFHYRNSNQVMEKVRTHAEQRMRTHLMKRRKVKDRGIGEGPFPSVELYRRYGLYKVPTAADWRSSHALA
jgi:hypothetical protein